MFTGTRQMLNPTYPDGKRPTLFQDGLEFQDFVCKELARRHVILQNLSSQRYQFEVGENLQGFEIKFDGRCTDTGRLSIEIAEKSRAELLQFTPSGIYRSDNSWLYIQGNYKILFVFAKNMLLGLHKSLKYREDQMPTIRKFYLPFSDAKKYAAIWMEFEDSFDDVIF